MTTVQIDGSAATLGTARSALKAQARHATDSVHEAIYQFKDPYLAGIWASVAAHFGRAYIALAEAKFL